MGETSRIAASFPWSSSAEPDRGEASSTSPAGWPRPPGTFPCTTRSGTSCSCRSRASSRRPTLTNATTTRRRSSSSASAGASPAAPFVCIRSTSRACGGATVSPCSAFRRHGLGAPWCGSRCTAGERGGQLMVAYIQPRNVEFFRKLGWRAAGEPLDHVGRPHQMMTIGLGPSGPRLRPERPPRRGRSRSPGRGRAAGRPHRRAEPGARRVVEHADRLARQASLGEGVATFIDVVLGAHSRNPYDGKTSAHVSMGTPFGLGITSRSTTTPTRGLEHGQRPEQPGHAHVLRGQAPPRSASIGSTPTSPARRSSRSRSDEKNWKSRWSAPSVDVATRRTCPVARWTGQDPRGAPHDEGGDRRGPRAP